MVQTNITAVMLTLNEADNIEDTLDSVGPIIEELVLVDGNSDDGTVELAEEWCEENSKDFEVLHSSEREYLLEGPGTQRRRGEELATRDYTLSIGADVEVEIQNQEWFEREFKHNVYIHTRVKASGRVGRDYRLYRPDPSGDMNQYNPDGQEILFDDEGQVPRWRGLIHEEIQTKDSDHVSDIFQPAEAPMVHKQKRHGAMDTHSVFKFHQRAHDTRVGGNTGRTLKKQHYLLKRALSTDRQAELVSPEYHDYYQENSALVTKHWKEIREEYDLPQEGWDNLEDVKDDNDAQGWALSDGEPIMDYKTNSAASYVKQKMAAKVGLSETRF